MYSDCYPGSQGCTLGDPAGLQIFNYVEPKLGSLPYLKIDGGSAKRQGDFKAFELSIGPTGALLDYRAELSIKEKAALTEFLFSRDLFTQEISVSLETLREAHGEYVRLANVKIPGLDLSNTSDPFPVRAVRFEVACRLATVARR